MSDVTDISPGNLDSSLCFMQASIFHDVLCICYISRVTIYNLDVLLSLCFYQVLYTFVDFASSISWYKLYPWLQLYAKSSNFFQKITESSFSRGHMIPVINHWSPGIEGFLVIHLITDQEHSGKLSWVHHHRMNQKHKEKLTLAKIKSCGSAIS